MIEPSIMWGWWNHLRAERSRQDATKVAVARPHQQPDARRPHPADLRARRRTARSTTNSLSRRLVPRRSIARPTATRAASRRSSRSTCSATRCTWDADHVVSNWATFYSSKDTLLLAEPAHDWWWYWWYRGRSGSAEHPRVRHLGAGPDALPRLGSRRRPDRRSVLARRGRRRDPRRDDDRHAVALVGREDERAETENHVWVLEEHGASSRRRRPPRRHREGRAHHVGALPGQQGLPRHVRVHRSAVHDRPRDRTQPRVVGELKVPGFSTYLHPIADGKLLSIGVDGTNALAHADLAVRRQRLREPGARCGAAGRGAEHVGLVRGAVRPQGVPVLGAEEAARDSAVDVRVRRTGTATTTTATSRSSCS